MSENEIKKPNLLKDSISLKAFTLNAFDAFIQALNETGNAHNTIMLLTTFGTIEGTFSSIAQNKDEFIKIDEQNKASVNVSYFIKFRNDQLIKYETENPNVKPNDYSNMIFLTDVVITPFQNLDTKYSIAQLFVFADQIIGFSAGEKSLQR